MGSELLSCRTRPSTAELKPIHLGQPNELLGSIEIHGEAVRVIGESEDSLSSEPPPDTRLPGAASSAVQRNITSADHTQQGRASVVLDENGLPLTTFEMLRAGTVAWSVTRAGLPNFYISNDGSTVLLVDQDIHSRGNGGVTIFGSDGAELGSLRPLAVENTRIANDGTTIVANTGLDGLLVLDRGARIVHRLPASFDFRLADNGRALASFQEKEIVVYVDGKKSMSVHTEDIPRDAAFTPDGKLMASVDRTTLTLADLDTRSIRFSSPAAMAAEELESVDLSQDGAKILVGKLSVTQRPSRTRDGEAKAEVALFDSVGRILMTKTFFTTNWNASTPGVEFFALDAKALVRTNSTLYELSLPKADQEQN